MEGNHGGSIPQSIFGSVQVALESECNRKEVKAGRRIENNNKLKVVEE
jgi:hypothetical protein